MNIHPYIQPTHLTIEKFCVLRYIALTLFLIFLIKLTTRSSLTTLYFSASIVGTTHLVTLLSEFMLFFIFQRNNNVQMLPNVATCALPLMVWIRAFARLVSHSSPTPVQVS